MAKRFTDSEKWKDPWFYRLEPEMKIFWLFVLDTCDHAGIWPDQMTQFFHACEITITESDIQRKFKGKIIKINSDTYFIPGFISFQYGILYENNNAHKGVLKVVDRYGLREFIETEDRPDRSIRLRLSKKKRLQIFSDANFTCEYCGVQFPPDALTIDHIQAISLGGDSSDENLACACAICNSYKSDFGLKEFLNKSQTLLAPSKRIKDCLSAPFSDLIRGTGLGLGYGLGIGIGLGKGLGTNTAQNTKHETLNPEDFFKGIDLTGV